MAKKVEQAPVSTQGLLQSRLINRLRTMAVAPEASMAIVAEADGVSYKVFPDRMTDSQERQPIFSVVRYNPTTTLVESVSLTDRHKVIEVVSTGITERMHIPGNGYFIPSVEISRGWDAEGRIERVEVIYELGVNNKDMAAFEYDVEDGGDLLLTSAFGFATRTTSGLTINRDIAELPIVLVPGFRLASNVETDTLVVRYGTNSNLFLDLEWRRDIPGSMEEIWAAGGFRQLAEPAIRKIVGN